LENFIFTILEINYPKKMAEILRSGKIAELVFLAGAISIVVFFQLRAMRGKPEPLRKMDQVEAISEGVDKAVEEGKPVYVSPGNMAYFSGLYAPMTINGMNILRYTARLCVRKGARVIFPVPYNPEALPLIDGIFREVCVSEGKPEAYRREDVHYYGGTEAAFCVGVGADIARNGASLAIFVGACSSSEMVGAGAARQRGALVIHGTPRYAHQSTAFVMADFPLFCEDVYGAGAICSGDPIVAASLVGGDLVKLLFFVAGTIVFALLTLAGLPVASKGGWLFK
jgi:hypothetical protein